MAHHQIEPFSSPESLEEAVSRASELAGEGRIVAGGTWVMRAPIRREKLEPHLISLHNISELHDIRISAGHVQIGSMASHAQIADAIADVFELRALSLAASKSANPAVRSMATIGGNLCSYDFPSSDLVPALIACDAIVHVQTLAGPVSFPIELFLERLRRRVPAEIVAHVEIPRGPYRTSHQRLLMRQAGEYPIVNVSVRVETQGDVISAARIAVGSVETEPKRWQSLEKDIVSKGLASTNFRSLAEAHLSDFKGRDGADAPGWYRTRVLSKMIEDAFDQIKTEGESTNAR